MTYPTKRLVEICSVATGKRDANHSQADGQYAFFTCAEKPIRSPTYSFDGDSIILPGNGANVGLVIFYSGKFEAYQRTYVLSGFKCNPRYVYHHLRRFWSKVNMFNQFGSATNYIRMVNFESYEIPIPPEPDQRRIAEILDRADSLRAKSRAALAEVDSLPQSIFLNMFGEPGVNPKAWPKSELGKFVKVLGGYAFKPEDFAAEGSPIVRISNLTRDGIDLAGIARIPDDRLGKGVGFKIQPGDILIAMSGATTGKLGVASLKLSEDFYQNQRVGNYRITDANKMHRGYLLELLRSTFYQRFLWQLAAGVAQPNVSGWQLESAVVPLPPIELQREFARRVAAVEKLKAAQRASLAELDALFASLQHRAFRGEL